MFSIKETLFSASLFEYLCKVDNTIGSETIYKAKALLYQETWKRIELFRPFDDSFFVKVV